MLSRANQSITPAMLLAIIAGAAAHRHAGAQTVFYSQNFDGAVLNQQSGDPAVTAACTPAPNAFTHNPPAGWSWNTCMTNTYACRVGTPTCTLPPNCGTCGTTEGVREWEGWSFTSTNFWGVRTDNQGRQSFTLGTGNVAVADPDEWDDRGDPDVNCGMYNAWMGTPAINIAGVTAGTLTLSFDSSWLPEGFDDLPDNNQTAIIRAYYTVGGVEQSPVEVMHWDSDGSNIEPGDYFKPDALNETVMLNAPVDQRHPGLQVPVGATAVRFEFGLVRGANDWWWALDNVFITGDVGGTPTTLFTENFDGVTLEPPVHEVITGCVTAYCNQNVYTHTLAGVGVTIDSPAAGGVPDWRGWSFVDRPYWNCTSGGNGSAFANSSGKIAVADGDEFDDLSHDPGPLDTTLTTPAIDISARSGSVLVLTFDSSWIYEDPQFASVTAEYNVGGNIEVLRWESNLSSPNFKADAPNELVAIPLTIPSGATSVVLKFRYSGFNNWYWAIDNIRLFEGETSVTVANLNPTQAVMTPAPNVNYGPCFTPWSPDVPTGWGDVFNPIGGCPTECGRPEWRGWSVGFKDWWWQRVDNQRRGEFALGTGHVAIADPDEWDDFPNGQSSFNAFMTTPVVTLPGTISSASLNFASSWRDEDFDDACSCDPVYTITDIAVGNPTTITTSTPHGLFNGSRVIIGGSDSTPSVNGTYNIGTVAIVTGPHTFTVPINVTTGGTGGTATHTRRNNQTAIVRAIYGLSGGGQQSEEVLKWDSDERGGIPGPFFHDDAPNEAVSIPMANLRIPPTAQSVQFEFSLTNARNDWWWAVDNIALNVNGNSIFTENFENVPNLQAPPTENPPVAQCNYFSPVSAQAGNLMVDNTGISMSCPQDDFYGFNAWLVDAWARELGGARLQHGASTAFISDFAARSCDGVARLITPEYGIGTINATSLAVTFRSGWFSEPGHVSTIEVSYDGGPWENVLTWNPGNKSTTPDENVTVFLNNQFGSNGVRIRFSDAQSGWWAISNLTLTGIVGFPTCNPDYNQDGSADNSDIFDLANDISSGTQSFPPNSSDFNRDGSADNTDILDLANTVASGACP